MISALRAARPATSRRIPWLRLLLLAAVVAAQTGCATSDADLDYTRQTAPDTTQDHSYHGWNNADF
jgi:hypothetical protein